jgi:hypothetical protein
MSMRSGTTLTPYLKEIREASTIDEAKQRIIKWFGDLNAFTLYNDDVLVATYARPDRTASGIIFAETNMSEDRFQGKVGLLLKAGPEAFKFNGNFAFNGINVEKEPDRRDEWLEAIPKVGDWVAFFPSEGKEIGMRGGSCRVFRSDCICMKITDPRDIY